MKIISKVLVLAALYALSAVVSPANASAQTKQETKLYKKTMKAPSRAAYEKFLSKMPESFYAGEIRSRLDTLLHVTPYSIGDARRIAAEQIGESAEVFFAFPARDDGRDRLAVLCLGKDGGCKSMTLECMDGKWTSVSEWSAEADGRQRLVLADEAVPADVDGAQMLLCGALYEVDDNSDGGLLFSRWLLNPFCETVPRMDFFGSDIRQKCDSLPFRIEGRINEMALNPEDKEKAWIKESMAKDPRLVELPFEVVQSDEAIRWWRRENSEVAAKGGTLKFCSLPEGCSLTDEYARSKYKTRNSKYVAALFDYRGWTVIVSQNRETGAFNLAWAEPECKDHARDVLLNGISFRSQTTLEMQYFHGKKYYKRMLNLASMTLK